MTKTPHSDHHHADHPEDAANGAESMPPEEQAAEASPESTTPEPEPEQTELTQRLQELEQQAAQYKDLFLRKAADFENFKRRTESEMSALARFANEDLLLAILPVVDDIERALKASPENDTGSALRKGIELILQKLTKILDMNGVKPMQTVGKPFDVQYHDVLLQIQRPDVEPHTIVEEVERGYLMHDRVLRHAKVVVAAGSDEDPSRTESGPTSEQKPTPSSEAGATP